MGRTRMCSAKTRRFSRSRALSERPAIFDSAPSNSFHSPAILGQSPAERSRSAARKQARESLNGAFTIEKNKSPHSFH
jgi:hypothetical protein